MNAIRRDRLLPRKVYGRKVAENIALPDIAEQLV
jgi:hypothetical protein